MSLELAVSELSKDKQVAVKSSFEEFLTKANEYAKIIQSLEIKDVNDKEGLDQARKARLFLKNQRGDAKRLTESKRNEIKAAKLEWDLLDKAWLKSFQFVEGVYKSLEEQAEEKEKYVEILEAKRKEEVRANRWKQLSEYMDFEPAGLDIMTDDVFGHVLNGAKAEKQARIEAEKKAEEERLEKERLAKLNEERRNLALPYYNFWSDFEKTLNFGEQNEGDFNAFMERIKKSKSDYDAEQARIKAENERLKKEAEAKEAARKAEIEAQEKKAKEEARLRAIEEAKKQAELDRIKAELEAERKRKEEEAKKQKEAELARIKAEEEAKKAPDKTKIKNAVDSLSMPVIELSIEGNKVYADIVDKFSKFKVWANNEVNKM
jgi:colicin import membrane protein